MTASKESKNNAGDLPPLSSPTGGSERPTEEPALETKLPPDVPMEVKAKSAARLGSTGDSEEALVTMIAIVESVNKKTQAL